jgi:hypothetical protein
MDKIIEKLNQALTPEEIDTLFGEACRRYEWLRFIDNGASINRVADIYDTNPNKSVNKGYLKSKFERFICIKSFACELDSRNLPRLGRVLYNTYFAKYEGGES